MKIIIKAEEGATSRKFEIDFVNQPTQTLTVADICQLIESMGFQSDDQFGGDDE